MELKSNFGKPISSQMVYKACNPIRILGMSFQRQKIVGLGFEGGGRTEAASAAARKTNFEGHEMDDGVGSGGGGGGDCRWMDGRAE